MKKIYKLNFYGEDYNIVLKKATYRNNDTLAILMFNVLENGEEEDFGDLTINISESYILADDTNAFVDTNNLSEKIITWLTKNKIAKKTYFTGRSGFCTYPLMSFNKTILEEMEELK